MGPIKGMSLIDFYTQESPFATEFRRLLQRLKKGDGKQELKALMITSATLSEGKSTISCLLSITAAKHGQKTLLIDTDLRRPTVHKLFKVDREIGLMEVLTEGLSAKNAVRKTELENLDLITAGRVSAEPAEVFDAPAIGRIVAELKFYYDLIVIDCAPIIPVSDPMLLSAEVDGTAMVIRAGKTPKEVARRAVEILNSSTGKLLGVILNNVSNTLPYYYNYDYYGYNYKPSRVDRRDSRRSRDPKGQSRRDEQNDSKSKKPPSGSSTRDASTLSQ